MLPARGCPGLMAYPPLAGNYGGAWQDQHRDFAAFPGPILMTSTASSSRILVPPADLRHGPVGWPGVRHLGHADILQLVKAAQALPGFSQQAVDDAGPEQPITVGFGHDAVLVVADPSSRW